MNIIDLVMKDLLQILRDWKAAFFLLIMPIGFTLLFGFIFSEPSTQEDLRLPVAVLDQDKTFFGDVFFDLLSFSETVRPVWPGDDPDIGELKTQVKDGDLSGVVVIPAVDSDKFLVGEFPQIEVIINSESNAGATAQWAIQGSLNRMMSAFDAALFSKNTLADFEPFVNHEAEMANFQESLTAAVAFWENPPVQMESSFTGQDDSESTQTVNSFTHSSPGMMVQFAVAGLIGSAEILVLERKSGALRRLLTTPVHRYEILLGHFLAMVVMILIQFAILIIFAQVFLDVPYFSAPFATFLVATATAIFTAAMGLLISTLAKTSEQVVVYSLIPMFVLSGLGGAWVPLEYTGEAFQKVAYFTPMAWSMMGFKNIIERGKGLESVLLPVGVILAIAVIVFGLAAWRFKFEEA